MEEQVKELKEQGSENPEALKEAAQPKKTERELLYEYINREDISKGLMASARNLKDQFRDNRFTLEQIIKKTNVRTIIGARQLMDLLELKGLAHKEIVAGKCEKYKITLSVKAQIATLQMHLHDLVEQARATQDQITLLEAQLPKEEVKEVKEEAVV